MQVKKSILQNIEDDLLKKLPKKSYEIEIGIIDGVSEKRDEQKDIAKYGHPSPQTNAELLYLHCNGSRPNKIPKRDVLKYTKDDWQNKLSEPTLRELEENLIYEEGRDEKDTDLYMDKVAEMLGGHCRDLISDRDKRIKPNSPKTIKLKGSDTPLIDTGNMRRAIVGRVKKK